MMTKHMLFCGFSMQDQNFARIFDSVQRARGVDDPTPEAASTAGPVEAAAGGDAIRRSPTL